MVLKSIPDESEFVIDGGGRKLVDTIKASSRVRLRGVIKDGWTGNRVEVTDLLEAIER